MDTKNKEYEVGNIFNLNAEQREFVRRGELICPEFLEDNHTKKIELIKKLLIKQKS